MVVIDRGNLQHIPDPWGRHVWKLGKVDGRELIEPANESEGDREPGVLVRDVSVMDGGVDHITRGRKVVNDGYVVHMGVQVGDLVVADARIGAAVDTVIASLTLKVEVGYDWPAVLRPHWVGRVQHECGDRRQLDGRLELFLCLKLEDGHGGVISNEKLEAFVEPGDRVRRDRGNDRHDV